MSNGNNPRCPWCNDSFLDNSGDIVIAASLRWHKECAEEVYRALDTAHTIDNQF